MCETMFSHLSFANFHNFRKKTRFYFMATFSDSTNDQINLMLPERLAAKQPAHAKLYLIMIKLNKVNTFNSRTMPFILTSYQRIFENHMMCNFK